MKIETKFNIGDYIWLMVNNKCEKELITSIQIEVNHNGFYVCYILKSTHKVGQSHCYATKDELLKSL